MCGIIITNKKINDLNKIEKYIINRGPDKKGIMNINNISFIHYLLNITGNITIQPFLNKEKNIVVLYNGEIYNYKKFGDYKSDGECLLPLYLNKGIEFVKDLDGEYAIVIVDFEKDKLYCVTDTFATKPLWIAINSNKFGISSYKSCLLELGFNSCEKITANKFIEFKLSTMTYLNEEEIYTFSLKQYKNNYNDWIKAFEKSVLKRVDCLKYDPFVCLSSGYDSGGICAVLNKYKVKYNTYTIVAKEDMKIVDERIKINSSNCKDAIIYKLNKVIFEKQKKHLSNRCENFKYLSQSSSILDDKASVGMAYIFNDASKKKRRVYLSGQGADEILSDYGFNGNKIYKHSQFGGKFPDKLENIFPWNSFYSGTQIDYLMKEELVSGSYGIEGRYPYLDKDTVQEFIWLTSELKNSFYKNSLDFYLKSENYPYNSGEKIGFVANHYS